LHQHQEKKISLLYKDLFYKDLFYMQKIQLLETAYIPVMAGVQLMSLSKTYVNFYNEPRVKNIKQQFAIIKLAKYACGHQDTPYDLILPTINHIRSKTIKITPHLAHFLLCIATGDIKRRATKNTRYTAGLVADIVIHELKNRTIQFPFAALLAIDYLTTIPNGYLDFVNRLQDEGLCLTLVNDENNQNVHNHTIVDIFNPHEYKELPDELQAFYSRKKFVFAEMNSN
jgi:hypothetical protein